MRAASDSAVPLFALAAFAVGPFAVVLSVFALILVIVIVIRRRQITAFSNHAATCAFKKTCMKFRAPGGEPASWYGRNDHEDRSVARGESTTGIVTEAWVEYPERFVIRSLCATVGSGRAMLADATTRLDSRRCSRGQNSEIGQYGRSCNACSRVALP